MCVWLLKRKPKPVLAHEQSEHILSAAGNFLYRHKTVFSCSCHIPRQRPQRAAARDIVAYKMYCKLDRGILRPKSGATKITTTLQIPSAIRLDGIARAQSIPVRGRGPPAATAPEAPHQFPGEISRHPHQENKSQDQRDWDGLFKATVGQVIPSVSRIHNLLPEHGDKQSCSNNPISEDLNCPNASILENSLRPLNRSLLRRRCVALLWVTAPLKDAQWKTR